MLNPLNKLFPRGRRVRRLALLVVVAAAVWVQHDIATAQWRGRLWGNLVLATAQAHAIRVSDGQTSSVCTDSTPLGQCAGHYVKTVKTVPLTAMPSAPAIVCGMWGVDWLGLPIRAGAPLSALDLQINILALDHGATKAYTRYDNSEQPDEVARQPVPPITEPHVQHLLDILADTIRTNLAVRPGATAQVILATRPSANWMGVDAYAASNSPYSPPMIQAGPAVVAYLRHQLGADAARVAWHIQPPLMHGPNCLDHACYQEIAVRWSQPGEPTWCPDPARNHGDD